MKRVIFIIIAILSVAYIAGTFFYFGRKKQPVLKCGEVEIVIKDGKDNKFLSDDDVVAYLKKKGVYPLNKEDVNTQTVEDALMKNEIVESAEVVQTVSGKIKIIVTQKTPVLRIFSPDGSYYVDKSGHTMPAVLGQAIYVPIASGNIEKSFAMTELYKFALFLQGDDFWNDQIEQIFVRSSKDVEIAPRVGSHRILLGSLDDYEKKLKRLRLFYEQVIPKMGWEKYSVINLKYRNQIVCTKK
ncbi:MAG: cell division protein FtsQ [Tannerella sp.]|jgi:cell division protein FtsQ|nr:cell division protein FtsQ [Tannerella sp.]